jgi:hypothetical protein
LKVYQKAPQATDFFTRQKVVLSLENNKKKSVLVVVEKKKHRQFTKERNTKMMLDIKIEQK